MYYYIKGEKILTGDGFAVIEAGGVGYRIFTSNTSINALAAAGGSVTMYVQLIVKEDAHELYGFTTNEELVMFRHLISVSGVGPKAALAVLSAATPERFALAVLTEDEKAITRAQGVGPKIARRIILELMDKLKKDNMLPDKLDVQAVQEIMPDSLTEAAAALTVLGYSANEAKNAVSKLDAGLSTEELVREGLKLLMR